MIRTFFVIFLLLFSTAGQVFAQAVGIIGADTPVNYPPVADPQEVTTPEATPVTIILTGDDANGDPLTFAIEDAPLQGSLSGLDPATGLVIYTPAAGFVGSDSFTFQVNDGIVDSPVATVGITVTGLSLSVSPATIAPGGTVTATWSGIATPTSTDWLGLYVPGAADTAYLAWRYTTGAASGSVPFVLPTTLAPGTYELRLLANDGFTRLATSKAFTVTP